MPNYVPCLTGEDQDRHLYAQGEPNKALCGKKVGGTETPGNRPVCAACAKRLLARIFENAGPGGVTSVEVTVH